VVKMGQSSKIVKKVLRYSNRTVMLSVGTIIPKNWNYIVIEKLKETDKELILKIRPLNGEIEKVLRDVEVSQKV